MRRHLNFLGRDAGARREECAPDLERPRPLSLRERQVLSLSAFGYSNKHIAYALGLACSTVSSHVASGMRRLRVSTRAQLSDVMFPWLETKDQ
jgi:DNA-binding NarL/FixJ family response regulator